MNAQMTFRPEVVRLANLLVDYMKDGNSPLNKAQASAALVEIDKEHDRKLNTYKTGYVAEIFLYLPIHNTAFTVVQKAGAETHMVYTAPTAHVEEEIQAAIEKVITENPGVVFSRSDLRQHVKPMCDGMDVTSKDRAIFVNRALKRVRESNPMLQAVDTTLANGSSRTDFAYVGPFPENADASATFYPFGDTLHQEFRRQLIDVYMLAEIAGISEVTMTEYMGGCARITPQHCAAIAGVLSEREILLFGQTVTGASIYAAQATTEYKFFVEAG